MTIAQMYLLRTAETTTHALRCALVLLETTHMTMEQADSPQQYLDGLYGLWDYLDHLADDLQEAVDVSYSAMKSKE